MQKPLVILLLFILSNSSVIGQDLKGLYFENLNNTVWISDSIVIDSNTIKTQHFGLTLVEENAKIDTRNKYVWNFDSNKVNISSNSRHLITTEYSINKSEKTILFNNLSFKYLPISTGSYVSFNLNNEIEITGKAQNSKDGAIIITKKGIYKIQYKEQWIDKFIGKNIRVQAIVIQEYSNTKKDLGYNTGIIQQGRLGKTSIIKLKSQVKLVN